jgi:hypothetical protein
LNSRTIGDEHVLQVSKALKESLEGNTITNYPEPTIKTANYIRNIYPNIKKLKNKFSEEVPDKHPDLTLTLKDNRVVKLNLFFISGQAAIQPKNLGAKSFLKKYFLDLDSQNTFNEFVERQYQVYLNSIIGIVQNKDVYYDARTLKAKVNKFFPKFVSEIEPFRQNLLFNLREFCFELMRDKFNEGNEGLINAFKVLFLDGFTNIITRHKNKNKCLYVEEFKPSIDINNSDISIYKKGNNSIGIQAGNEALLLRFKFESGPTSSLKLATSFEKAITKTNIIKLNLDSLKKYEKIIEEHEYKKMTNISNAIGKCNEAMVYYQFVKQNTSIHQVDPDEYHSMLGRYSVFVTKEILLNILTASVITIEKIEEYMKSKYSNYLIESIQLVSDSYLTNRLDTSDIKLILKVNNKIIEESFSLKAIKNRTAKITLKNPGIGQILGPQYFDLRDPLSPLVKEIKEKFLLKEYTHQESLIQISKTLGDKLIQAQQNNLKKGLHALIGSITMVVTFYKQNECVVLEHEKISGPVEIFSLYPSPIQTTLFWNEKKEELALRVKFSAGQSKGWSSLKLACEYKVNY